MVVPLCPRDKGVQVVSLQMQRLVLKRVYYIPVGCAMQM